MNTKTSIKFINHASYIISYKDINLLVDPWFDGNAFNDGWSLVSPTYINDNIIKSLTHIWISHEHPDHFSIPDLIRIRKINKNVKILFQRTKDKRVYNFLINKSFEVIELNDLEEFKILSNFTIKIVKIPNIDSLSIVEVNNKIIINTNDCILNNQYLNKVQNLVNKCDILFTQFSYASWIGNPNEKSKREKASSDKLNQIKEQINSFKPNIVIPFASFIYFSHNENFYMNDSINKLDDIVKLIQNSSSKPLILYPGSTYTIDEKYDFSEINLEKYNKDFESIKSKKKITSQTITEKKLINSSNFYINKIQKKNNIFIIFIIFYLSKIIKKIFKNDLFGFGDLKIYIIDLDMNFKFNLINGLYVSQSKDFDVAISSQSLDYIFNYEWGIGSLMINGRGYYKNEKSKWLFIRGFSLGLINSNGETLISKIFQKLVNKKNNIDDIEPSFIRTNKKNF
tara:strand:- start:701 stop:2065 length:1365 start_codon:yes stop_codon:yes gene_type:complete